MGFAEYSQDELMKKAQEACGSDTDRFETKEDAFIAGFITGTKLEKKESEPMQLGTGE